MSTPALENEGPVGDHLCTSLSWGLDPGSQVAGEPLELML